MSDIFKGDPASQETEDPWLTEECKNCGHEREAHLDRAGCLEVDEEYAEPDINSFPRCHCTNFEVKENG